MNKEKLKKIKVLYYPYKAVKKIITGTIYYIQYIISLLYISKNTKRVKKKIANGEVLNVVFIIQYIPGWNKLEPIYKKMLDDDRFNPIIVCVPLNIQNHILMDGKGNDTYQYFIEHGYKAIDALLDDGSWFDLKKLEPDYLFHSRPYNAFMPKCYTSGKIVKYALICNVMYGACLAENDRKVCINKDYFKNAYLYFAFDDSEKKYYQSLFKFGLKYGLQKCYPYGATGLEQIVNFETKQITTKVKHTILWTPRWSTDKTVGGSNFFNYRDTILQLASKNPNIVFIIRPHPLMFSNFLKTGEMTEQEVYEFKEHCNSSSNIVLDETKSYTETFWNSSLLITDFSGIVPEYFVTGKPIIYCHSNVNFEYTDTTKHIIHCCYEAFDSKDIEQYMYKVINREDVKLQERKECTDWLFPNINQNSTNILESLITTDNHLKHHYS